MHYGYGQDIMAFAPFRFFNFFFFIYLFIFLSCDSLYFINMQHNWNTPFKEDNKGTQ